MTATWLCPRCGQPLILKITGTLGPTSTPADLTIEPDPLSLRRHARCFMEPTGGGEPIPLPIAA